MRPVWLHQAWSIFERFGDPASAKHESVGDETERRQVDIADSGRRQFDKAPVEPAIFGFRGIDQDLAARDQASTAGGELQRPAIGRCDGANMLIARDLAEADDGDPDWTHCQRPQRNTTGSSRRAISINPARVTGCMAGCGARIVSWAMTRPSFIRTLHAAGPHCRFS